MGNTNNLLHLPPSKSLCTLLAFHEAVDQNPFLWFSQKFLIIAAICCNGFIPYVISFKKIYTFMALSSVLYEIWLKKKVKITASRIAIVVKNHNVLGSTSAPSQPICCDFGSVYWHISSILENRTKRCFLSAKNDVFGARISKLVSVKLAQSKNP